MQTAYEEPKERKGSAAKAYLSKLIRQLTICSAAQVRINFIYTGGFISVGAPATAWVGESVE
jgi:hypothetical protein